MLSFWRRSAGNHSPWCTGKLNTSQTSEAITSAQGRFLCPSIKHESINECDSHFISTQVKGQNSGDDGRALLHAADG